MEYEAWLEVYKRVWNLLWQENKEKYWSCYGEYNEQLSVQQALWSSNWNSSPWSFLLSWLEQGSYYFLFWYVSYIFIQDGVISFEEMQTKNITKEDFNTADLDQDGFIIPAELDDSLN